MAIFSVSPAGGAAAAAAASPIAQADDKSLEGASVYPQLSYFILAGASIVVGTFAGTFFYDRSNVTFNAPEGVGIFALFYIIAQVIERVQEPLAPFLGRAPAGGEAPPDGGKPQVDQRKAKAELEVAVATALRMPSSDTAKDVANKKRTVDQIRANLTVGIFGTSALLAMLLMGYLKAGLLRTVGVTGVQPWVEVLATGLIVAAGTKPLHDFISKLKETKEEEQDPEGTQ